MDWSVISMSHKIDARGCTINQVARWYFEQELFVNRRYQRKLVWTFNEKMLFIDSILNKFPTPAIIINHYDILDQAKGEGRSIYEIVDGLQRLDAIFSFIRGDFGIKYGDSKTTQFYDISVIPSARVLLKDRGWKQHSDLLPIDLCADFADSELPIILTGQEQEKIEEIFRRINSTGRKVSSHDLRQASSVGEFPDLVRRIASDIRIDCTFEDHIWLADMPKISVGSKEHGFGVDIETVFWRRHDLFPVTNMRESKDEEIIESLLATVLLGNKFKKSKTTLDKLYDITTALGSEIEKLVIERGKDELEYEFVEVFDIIDNIFNAVNSSFSKWLFFEKKVKNKDECFKILFLALYKLKSESYVIDNYKAVADTLKHAGTIFTDFINADRIDYEKTIFATENLYNILKAKHNRNIHVKNNSKIEEELDKRLSYSILERQMTEFKIGVSNHADKTVNLKCIESIAQTLVAMANVTNSTEIGVVIIGVADSRKAYEDWNSYYGKGAIVVQQHYIPGITCEAEKLYGNEDRYYRQIRKIISDQPISKALKDFVLETFDVVNYHGIEVMVFKSKYMNEISLYDGVKYIRNASETLKM